MFNGPPYDLSWWTFQMCRVCILQLLDTAFYKCQLGQVCWWCSSLLYPYPSSVFVLSVTKARVLKVSNYNFEFLYFSFSVTFWFMHFDILLFGIHIFRVSFLILHYWHLGLDNFLVVKATLCTRRCSAASLASTL